SRTWMRLPSTLPIWPWHWIGASRQPLKREAYRRRRIWRTPFVLPRSWCAAPCFRIGSSLPYSSGAPHVIRKEGLPGFLIGLLLLSGLVAAADVPARAQESAWTQLPWDERIGLGWYRQLAERGDPE